MNEMPRLSDTTGKRMSVTGMSVIRVQGGQIAEAWNNFDVLGMGHPGHSGRTHQLRECFRRFVSIKTNKHVTPATAAVTAARLAMSCVVPNAPRGSTA